MLYIYVPSETDLKVGSILQVAEIGERELRDGTVVRQISLVAQQSDTDEALWWTCKKCTAINREERTKCRKCSSRR